MGLVGLLILAAIPFVSVAWGQSLLIFIGGAMVLIQVRDNQQAVINTLSTMAGNQQKIYNKVSKRG